MKRYKMEEHNFLEMVALTSRARRSLGAAFCDMHPHIQAKVLVSLSKLVNLFVQIYTQFSLSSMHKPKELIFLSILGD